MRSLLPLLSVALLCTACDLESPTTPATPTTSSGPAAPTPSASPSTPEAPTHPATDPTPATPVAPPSAAALGPLAASSNALGLDIYAKARSQAGNLALSPISISTALTMTWGGARGETAAQMQKVLHAEGDADKAMDVSGKLLASLGGADGKVKLRVANRLFGEKAYTFEKAYLDRTQASFGAPLEPLDFKHAADASRVHINDWVAEQTQKRITNLLPAGSINADTRLVLTNAIYFLGDWLKPFSKDATHPAAFHVDATHTKDVPMMSQVEPFRFAAVDAVKVLEMPYEGGELAMALVLPDAPTGLDAVEQRLTPQTLDKWLAAAQTERVAVTLPKFEIDPAESLSLGSLLVALGMPLAFDRDKADFTAMANPPTPADRLYISKVFHKAFVKVDEKGTEAAAATAVVMARAGAAPPSNPPAEFKADHPFLFFIRHVRSGTILFMGRVSDPATK